MLRINLNPPPAACFLVVSLFSIALSNATEDFLQSAEFFKDIPSKRIDLSLEDREKVQTVTRPTDNFLQAEKFEAMQGGAGTSHKLVNRDAFSHSSANLTFEDEQKFQLGNALFRKQWISSPSSTHASDGLGPLFNARSCQSCHIKDGRGHPPEGDRDATSMFLRLARPAMNANEQKALRKLSALNFPDPTYGSQLQDLAVPGLKSEGTMVISYSEQPVELADSTVISLRKPHYKVTDLGYGPLHPKTTFSPRIANPMIGLGLVEAIHSADILALADPDDKDGDGISGRVALTRDPQTGDIVLGRFGWKAQNPFIRSQSANAFAGDIGISTPDIPKSFGDATPNQTEAFSYPTGVQEHLGNTEAPNPILDFVTFYSQNLAVPVRRDVNDLQVLRGKQLFYQSSCISCHTPKFVTRRDAKNRAQSFQLIWPYSDFLLHDMGEGLADGQTVGVANGREWRTPPLWGIGLTKTVSDHTFFLHDGRARNLTEAILWHGGEAKKARDTFKNFNEADRRALIRFLESL